MYVAEQHAMDHELALAHAAARGVGDLITCGERGIDVTYLPFALIKDEDGSTRLTTHLARTNLQWQDEGPAMWVIHGPDAYIGPDIVPERPQPQPMPTVPTWNYLVIHLKGRLITHHDPAWKLRSLRELIDCHEPRWRLENGPLSAIEKMLPAIVGLEFVVEEVIGKAKLSQNRSSTELVTMATTLADSGHSPETAELMRRLALPYIEAREERVAQARELKLRPAKP